MEELKENILALNISDDEKEKLLKNLKAAQKLLASFEFKYNRTVIDKAAIFNILNASLDEIEKQKKIIEAARDEIDRTLTEVDKQKKLVDEKNKALNKLLDDLKETQQQLVMSEKMASLGQLTAGVAHEINNPINFVSANIKPLKEDLAEIIDRVKQTEIIIKENNLEHLFVKAEGYMSSEHINYAMVEVMDLLRGIEEGASRTSEIVKGLRNFSRLDQNVMKQADIREGIESTLTLLHSFYKDNVEIEKDFAQVPKIDCLPGEINQVLMNILSNAIQAITGKGKIFINVLQQNDLIKISIQDTGSGMSEVTKQKVFDPFFTTKDVGKGTGLGLSISYGIIEKHNGKIEVESEIGKGTKFIISLPIHQIKNEKLKTT